MSREPGDNEDVPIADQIADFRDLIETMPTATNPNGRVSDLQNLRDLIRAYPEEAREMLAAVTREGRRLREH